MFLKMMSAENVADSDSRKSFQLIDHVSSVAFIREGVDAFVNVYPDNDNGDESTRFPVVGNCYLMNDEGRTIAQFGAGPPRAAA